LTYRVSRARVGSEIVLLNTGRWERLDGSKERSRVEWDTG
jgi:hypothetical protein